MATYVQAARPLTVTTPLGGDALLLRGFTGSESLSRLFQFQLDLSAENSTDVAFDKLLGQKVTVRLALPSGERYFNGLCSRVSQGERDEVFTAYRMELVPQFWLLTRRAQSRIFQHLSVPDILKQVLTGLDVAYEIQGTFEPRDYCVQYRETDFNFASRLMEEEGIYYFFKHAAGGHQMVLANTPGSHPDLPGGGSVIFDRSGGGHRDEDRVSEWEKAQELRSGKYTLWDHCFELPHKHLEAEKATQDSVTAGTVSHKLKVGGNDKLELYDYPGEYAQRFDGIQPGGGDRPDDLQKIFQDNQRTTGIRMQQEAAAALHVRGAGNCRHFVSGHKFTLQHHFNADGPYVLTGVQHAARLDANYRSDGGEGLEYRNSFTCIPLGLPFRPARGTPKPVVQGSQTAVVVGPAGEEIFCDKYSRVKVQFHWDRQGQNNADSSCWCRVSTLWAGKQWGVIHIPRIGQEVIVDFLEGDPDQPIITGSVYNAEMMPPYELPAHKTQSGVKSRSSLKGTEQNFNEIRFEDKKGAEQLYIHAEKNQDIEVEHDESHFVGHDRKKEIAHDEQVSVGNNRTESVGANENIAIGKDRTTNIQKNEKLSVGENRNTDVGKNEDISVGGNRTESVSKDESITIAGNRAETVSKDETLEVNGNRFDKVGKNDQQQVGAQFGLVAGDQIIFETGDASIVMKKNGDIQIKGNNITIVGSGKISAKADGNMTLKGSKIAEN